MQQITPDDGRVKRVVQIADYAGETIAITELSPVSGAFIGKKILLSGEINEYPGKDTWWFQRVELVPATIKHLFAYLRTARDRNICLIRGAPANLERVETLRQIAGIYGQQNRGDHGFDDVPTKLFFLDLDGAPVCWKNNPEKAICSILDLLGEPWSVTSFVWFFSASHGLEKNDKHWTGKIIDGKMNVRIAFITDRALNDSEAAALTKIVKAKVPEFCLSLHTVQPNYIRRPMWVEHPDRDPLGDMETIGRVERAHDCLAIPDDLATKARWAKAQGYNVDIADHPDAETAVRAAGSDNAVRSHLMSAVVHLLKANPCSEVVSFADHSMAVVSMLQSLLDQHREQILANLAPFGRGWGDVMHYMPDNQIDFAMWSLNHPASLRRKTIKLIKEEKPQQNGDDVTLDAICARVERAIERFRHPSAYTEFGDRESSPTVELLAAPTGSRKSTLIRAAAVADVMANPGKSVVILVPRHRLGAEQIKDLLRDHPNANAAVWRGRQAWTDDSKTEKTCLRADEAQELQNHMVNVDHHLCKQGRGKEAIKCPLFDACGYQRQKLIAANIWFCAHEMLGHEMPKAFGDVMRVYIDESPLDAVTFGLDSNDPHTLALDRLLDPPELEELDEPRRDLYRMLDKLKFNKDDIAPVTRQVLADFGFTEKRTTTHNFIRKYDAHQLANLEWRAKIKPQIRPDMTAKQVRHELKKAVGNRDIKLRAMIWQLIDEAEGCGRIQVHRGKKGRFVRIVGLRRITEGWSVPILISDATGDIDLLRAVWPQIEAEPWPQLPRPDCVRVFQIVDRTLSKYAVAVESKTNNKKELERKADGARRMYAAVLLKALEYDGADVGVITYKSTEDWIKENCFVPAWLKLAHHGDVTGTNNFQDVRALFEVGRNQPPPQALALQAEALFGTYIEQREYVQEKARIAIVPDEAGNTIAEVTIHQHRDPTVRKLLWQAREGASIQNFGRARAGLRNASSPLDIHRWSDLPVPELGPVGPVLWSEVDAGLDALMLAAGGVWLHCIPDAVKAFTGLLTENGLKSARKHSQGLPDKGLLCVRYQRAGARIRSARALSLRSPEETKTWLEAKLGPLARFEVVTADAAAEPTQKVQ